MAENKVKSTFKARAVSTIIQYQKRNQINSLTIGGDDRLGDLTVEGNNNVTIHLNNDSTKENVLEALNELIEITHGTNGTDEKTGLLVPHDELKIDRIELVDDTTNQLAEIDYTHEGEHPNIERVALLKLIHDIDKLDKLEIELPNKDMKPLLEYSERFDEDENGNQIKIGVLYVQQDEWKADTIVTNTPDLLEVTDHWEELPDADRRFTELNLKLNIFSHTWGEYYDYVAIYALGNTEEKYEGYAPFLEDPVTGWYDEEKNRTTYIFATNQDNYEYNPYIILRTISDQNEVYRVIARSADLNQWLKYAPDYVEGNFNEEGVNIPGQIAELKDKIDSEIKVLTWSWSVGQFLIATKGDTTNTAYGYYLSYNEEWGNTRYTGVYYESMDTTVYSLPIPDGVGFKNLALALGDFNHTLEYWSNPVYRPDWSITETKSPYFIDNKPVINNIDPAQFPITVYQSWKGTKFTLRLYGNTVGVFNVRGQTRNITGAYNSSYNYTQYEMDLATWNPFSSGVLYVQKGTGGLAYLSIYLTQPDWNETDSKQPDFIKNKPDLTQYVLKTDYDALLARVEALENA